MAISLTTPIVTNIHSQGITKIDFFFPHAPDYDNNMEMKLDRDNIVVTFHVTSWDENGVEVDDRRYKEVFVNWPGLFTDDVTALYGRLEAYAKSQNYMSEGTAEEV